MSIKISTSTWARAREAYLAGESAGAVCRRFHISRSAFFSAAQAGGWRRADRLVGETPGADEPPAPPGEALPAVDLAETAMARASDAVMGGRLHEAQGWTRLAAELRRLAAQEVGDGTWAQTLGTTIDAETEGRSVADRLANMDSPDSNRTPLPALTHERKRLIGAEPDHLDSPVGAGLLPMPDDIDARFAWAEAEIAKLEARDRGRMEKLSGP